LITSTYKVYIFGDSIGFGQLITPSLTWVNDLSNKLIKLKKDKEIILQNPSINGCTTRQALERIYYDCTSHKPDLVLVQFGLNDCNYWDTDYKLPRVLPNAFMENLKEILLKIEACGTTKLFLNTNHPTNKGYIGKSKNINYEESNRKYNHCIREVYKHLKIKNLDIDIIDIEEKWDQILKNNNNIIIDDFLLPDGVHLNLEGHNLYKKIVNKKIISFIDNNI
tara:strand:- start:638 stop:1306 length:669 start_codon:yes stop_codon:yes gene_type:complete